MPRNGRDLAGLNLGNAAPNFLELRSLDLRSNVVDQRLD